MNFSIIVDIGVEWVEQVAKQLWTLHDLCIFEIVGIELVGLLVMVFDEALAEDDDGLDGKVPVLYGKLKVIHPYFPNLPYVIIDMSWWCLCDVLLYVVNRVG